MVQLSPGVQVVEKDYTQIVPTVSTSRGAFAGAFKWGPVEEPTLITSESELVSVFEKPTDDNYLHFFTAKNFLDYSNSLYVSRIDSESARNAVALKSGRIADIDLVFAGSGYTAIPNVTISAPAVPDGVQASAVVVLTGGKVTGATVVDGGSGYEVGDTITLSDPEQPTLIENQETGELEEVYVVAVGKVTSVGANNAITGVSFTTTGAAEGAGYIVSADIAYEITTAAGAGANLTFGVAPSAVKQIDMVETGSGYTATQTVTVTITPTQVGFNPTNAATARANVEASGAKIKNKTHYDSAWSNGQGAYGEFAAKYPGVIGNSLTVSMADGSNWSTPVNGLFSARKTIESKENARELKYVRRVLNNEASFSNEALDAGKVLFSQTKNLPVGEVSSILSGLYRKITIKPATGKKITYNASLDQHIRHSDYAPTFSISRVARDIAGVVTITTTANHNYVAGQYITVAAKTNTPVNVINAKITSVTSNTFTYVTKVKTVLTARADSGTVFSKSMGTLHGFVKDWNTVSDVFELDNTKYYVTVEDTRNEWKVGKTLVDYNGDTIGVITKVEQVQVIVLANNSTYDVYSEDELTADWKYKSYFGTNAPGTSVYAAKNGGQNDEMHVVVVDRDGLISGVAGNVLETFAEVSKASDAKLTDGKSNYYKDVINNTSSWIWVLDHTPVVEGTAGKANWGQPAKNASFKLMTNQVTRNLSGGVDSTNWSEGNLMDAYGMYDDQAAFDVSLMPLGHLPTTTANWIIDNVVEQRMDCVAFLSAPLLIGTASSIATQIVAYRNELQSSSYAVLDSTWKYQYDKYADKFRWVPMAGDVAGLCAHTDMVADPWFSPGGFNRGQIKNVTKIAFNPTLPQRDELYKNGVNPIVTFPGEGTILYGDKTLQTKASAFDRINVRRLFITLEKAVALAAKYQLFEFNDDFTRAQFRSMVEPYLRDVQGRRGIIDFVVKCDTTNNTPEVIDRNEFIADIYIKPNRSINFITLNFIATKTGVKFEELGA